MINHKNPVKDFRLFGLIWLATIFIFLVFLGLLSNNQVNFSTQNNFSSFLLTIFLMDILIGIIAFPFIILNGFRCLRSISKEKLGNKISRWIKSIPLTTMIILAIVLLTGTVLAKNKLITLNLSGNNKTVNVTPAPTPEPTLIIPSADPNPTTRPTPRPTQKPVYIDPDPLIDCKSSAPNCNGSSIRVHQSQCSKITCCQIGSSWSVYPTSEKCADAQKSAQPQQVTPQTTQKTSTNSVYCWNNAYGYAYYTSSGDQCNLDNLKSSTNKTCNDTQRMKVDSCNSTCNSQLDQDRAACAYAYTGANAAIEQNSAKYGECLNGTESASSSYSACLTKCTDQFAQDLKQCN